MALFKDLLKKWFYQNSSQAASTSARIPLLDSGGNPIGSDTMDNFASVLGAWKFFPSYGETDTVDLYEKSGIYHVTQDLGGGINNGILVVFNSGLTKVGDKQFATQFFFPYNTSYFYVRIYWYGNWRQWVKVSTGIPDFYKNYADLNALTNALVAQNALSIGNVMVVTNAGSYTHFLPADRALESGIANIAVGAGIIENGRTLIIAKDTTTKKWAESSVAGGNSYLKREAAVADFNGRTNTNKILETLGDNAPAATYCHTYHPANVDSADTNMGAGRWWLPSFGELAMIWAHVREINFVLSAIGGTQIPVGGGWMWSSTEGSATGAWHLLFGDGIFYNGDKSYGESVRPVSSFY